MLVQQLITHHANTATRDLRLSVTFLSDFLFRTNLYHHNREAEMLKTSWYLQLTYTSLYMHCLSLLLYWTGCVPKTSHFYTDPAFQFNKYCTPTWKLSTWNWHDVLAVGVLRILDGNVVLEPYGYGSTCRSLQHSNVFWLPCFQKFSEVLGCFYNPFFINLLMYFYCFAIELYSD